MVTRQGKVVGTMFAADGLPTNRGVIKSVGEKGVVTTNQGRVGAKTALTASIKDARKFGFAGTAK